MSMNLNDIMVLKLYELWTAAQDCCADIKNIYICICYNNILKTDIKQQ